MLHNIPQFIPSPNHPQIPAISTSLGESIVRTILLQASCHLQQSFSRHNDVVGAGKCEWQFSIPPPKMSLKFYTHPWRMFQGFSW